MKKLLFGVALIWFGILLILLGSMDGGPWIPIIDTLPWDWLGLASGVTGLVFAAVGMKER